MPGLLVVIITISGYFFGAEFVSGHLHNQIAEAMSCDAADQVKGLLIMSLKNKDSLMATIIGLATILIGATAVFAQLQQSLNTIWEVKASTTKSGILTFLKVRLFSFGLII